MEISVRKYKEKHIVDVRGELDLYNAFRLKETVQKMVAMDIRVFILNLKGVDYVDSSGIGALLSINDLLAREGRKLRIANITRQLQKVMDLTRLTGFLPLCRSVREAVEAIDGSSGGSEQRPPKAPPRGRLSYFFPSAAIAFLSSDVIMTQLAVLPVYAVAQEDRIFTPASASLRATFWSRPGLFGTSTHSASSSFVWTPRGTSAFAAFAVFFTARLNSAFVPESSA